MHLLRALASHVAAAEKLDTRQPYSGTTIDLDASASALSQNPLLDPAPHPSLNVATAALRRATRPTFFDFGDSPLDWAAAEWDALRARQQAEPLFDMAAVRAQFDRQRWELEGVLVLESVMTEATRARWAAACREVQATNDRFLAEHQRWRQEVDWRTLGAAAPPTHTLSAEEVAIATGQTGGLPHGWPRTDVDSEASGVRTLRMHSVLPEFFPRESQRPLDLPTFARLTLIVFAAHSWAQPVPHGGALPPAAARAAGDAARLRAVGPPLLPLPGAQPQSRQQWRHMARPPHRQGLRWAQPSRPHRRPPRVLPPAEQHHQPRLS